MALCSSWLWSGAGQLLCSRQQNFLGRLLYLRLEGASLAQFFPISICEFWCCSSVSNHSGFLHVEATWRFVDNPHLWCFRCDFWRLPRRAKCHPVSANIEISWNSQDLEWKQKCWKRLCLQHISKSWWLGVVFKFCFSRPDNGKASPRFPVPHLPSPSLRLVSLSKHRLHQVLKTEMQWGILDRAA